ncbi:MAG: ATP-binding domain-containing protein [Myxococcales bacterium]|nr:ATP-binding domain-containing protein [Myxococcales bacterium]
MSDTQKLDPESMPADDSELRKVVGEEKKTLQRVVTTLKAVRETVRRNYDQELVELRDAIGEARMEDVPALMAEMERLRNVADRRAEVPTGKVDLGNPYFGHMKLKEGDRTRDVLIGNSTYIDTDNALRIVDWRDAPVSRIYYRYAEGDEYEEDFGGRTLEGQVVVRRAVVIRDTILRRVVGSEGTFFRTREGWQRGVVTSSKLQGGQLSAVRPPTDDERRDARKAKGRLGVGVDSKEDKHLPEIPALIDPRQFELITKPSSGLVVIQGGAGSGKTTIGLHRMAYLAFNNPKRFSPDRMMVVVFNKALANYIVRVLPSLGVEGVPVVTYGDWVSNQRKRHLSKVPSAYHEDTPALVTRLKKHPALLRLIDKRVAAAEAETFKELDLVAARSDSDAVIGKAWRALEGQALTRRITGLSQWIRGERELPGLKLDALPQRGRLELQRTLDRLQRRAKDVVWDWAELITDGAALWREIELSAKGAFSRAEIDAAVRWNTEHVTRWVVADTSEEEDEGGGGGENKADREARRSERKARRNERLEERAARRIGDEDLESEEIVADAGRDAVREDRAQGRFDDDDEGGGREHDPFMGADGVREEEAASAVDFEDDALLLRLYQRKRGPLRGQGKQPLAYEHLFVDEAQDLSPVELAVLLGATGDERSVTLAGDTAQKLLMDNGFRDWASVLEDLGLASVNVEPLKIGYRSTMEVLAFARAILGPLADPEPPLATRQGAPVEFHQFGDAGAAVAFLGESLRMLAIDEPRANVAVITRDPERADLYYQGLVKAEVPRLSRVRDQDFNFKPGVEVTDIRQVKGLEFDYVILMDVTSHQYPVDNESRHLLHIGATRAAHQLWVVAAGTPSALLPGWMFDD